MLLTCQAKACQTLMAYTYDLKLAEGQACFIGNYFWNGFKLNSKFTSD